MAAHFCSRCGKEVSSAARFCPHCGAPLLGGSATVAAARMDTAARGTRRLLVPLVIAVLAVLVIAVFILAARLRQEALLASHTAPAVAPPLTNTPLQPLSAPPITNAPPGQPTAAPAITNAPTTPAGGLPPDVAAYLKFLQGIEQRRVALTNDTTGAMGMLATAHQMQANQNDTDDPDSQTQTSQTDRSKISGGFTDYSAKWQTLMSDFRSQPPPAPCAALANQYWTFLDGYAKVIGQLQVALLNGDLGAAMSAQSSQKQLDSDAIQADTDLAELCDHYNAPKPFSIQPDDASSSLLGE